MTTDVEAIALRLLEAETQLRALATTSQLAYSSIEDGSINAYNADGSLQAVVGRLPDATVGMLVVNAPPPPTPSVPIVQSAPHGYVVTWDGHNEDGTDTQPLNWSRLEIHSSVTAGFDYSPSTLRGTFESTQGGSQVCIAGLEYELGVSDVYEVLFVARNTSGAPSLPSGRIVVSVGQIEQMDVADFALTVRKFQSEQHLLY